jgi:hypothetical protein
VHGLRCRTVRIEADWWRIGPRLSPCARAAGRPLLFGLRLWASVCLALYVAYWLELDNAYWAGRSAAIVCQPHLGASLRKGWFWMIAVGLCREDCAGRPTGRVLGRHVKKCLRNIVAVYLCLRKPGAPSVTGRWYWLKYPLLAVERPIKMPESTIRTLQRR